MDQSLYGVIISELSSFDMSYLLTGIYLLFQYIDYSLSVSLSKRKISELQAFIKL